MATPDQVSMTAAARHRYRRLCEAYRIRPSVETMTKIQEAILPFNTRFAELLQPSLLFFLPVSAMVYRAGTLLVGWITLDNGSRQEVWMKQKRTRLLAYFHAGEPAGSTHTIKRYQAVCDEWHPALDNIFDLSTCNDRREQYALFSACIKLLESASPPPLIEDFRPPVTQAQRLPVAVSKRLAATRTMPPTRERVATEARSRTSPTIQIHTLIQRPRFRAPIAPLSTTSSTLVLASNPKPPSTLLPVISNRNEQPTPAGQELRTMLQSKRVNEIQAMLTERSDRLPLWITKIAQEEMEKKMRRDLDVLKNFF